MKTLIMISLCFLSVSVQAGECVRISHLTDVRTGPDSKSPPMKDKKGDVRLFPNEVARIFRVQNGLAQIGLPGRRFYGWVDVESTVYADESLCQRLEGLEKTPAPAGVDEQIQIQPQVETLSHGKTENSHGRN